MKIHKNLLYIEKLVNNKKIIFIAIAIIVIAILACPFSIQIIKNTQEKQMKKHQLLQYEIISTNSDEEDEDNAQYNILIRITSLEGIETVTYKKINSQEEITLYCKGRTQVAIDYVITEGTTYDFKIKQVGINEVLEQICYETPYIEGKYSLVNGLYSNEPDLTGYNEKNTRYLVLNEKEKLTPANWINEAKPTNWYDYNNAKWANIYVESKGIDVYYTWIPRYCYKIDETKHERTDVKFIDVHNNYKDAEGNTKTWKELKQEGYQIPVAFKFNGTKLPGYWAMKYTVGDTITPSIINYNMSVTRGKIDVSRIKLNTSITNNNPIAKYTFAINGIIKETVSNSEELENIESRIVSFVDLNEGENIINVTALNANGEIVGSMTKRYVPAQVNPPELKGFNPDTTFYVTYDANGIETSVIPITKGMPEDWYEYGEARWANIVTRNNGLETYYTWIPRYRYTADNTNETTDVEFLLGTDNGEESDDYQVPEAFTFNGVPLTGYWAMKYTAGENTAPRFSTEVTATSNSIKTKGITGSSVGENQTYIYYMNGEEKHRTTNKNENYEYKNLESGKLYTILVDIRNSTTNEYIGTVVKQIKTIEPNKPELIGFNENMTYYVTYEKNEGTGELEEKVGNKIKNDGSNTPQNWYNYSNRMWANIVVTDGKIENGKIIDAKVTTYYTWIPRYCYKITPDQTAQPEVGRSEVRFIKDNLTEEEIKEGWLVPEAFTFADKQINGYWAMKYTAGE